MGFVKKVRVHAPRREDATVGLRVNGGESLPTPIVYNSISFANHNTSQHQFGASHNMTYSI